MSVTQWPLIRATRLAGMLEGQRLLSMEASRSIQQRPNDRPWAETRLS